MHLRPTDSVAELRHRAALYQQGLMPQMQQQAHMPVLMQPMHMSMQMPMMAVPVGVGAGSTTAASHASMYAGTLPYSAAQAQQAALYHAFLQQQSSLQGQLRPHAPAPGGGGYRSDSACSTCSGRHGNYSRSPSRSRSRSRSRSHSRSRMRHSHRSYHSDEHADCVSCNSSCSCTSGCDSEGEEHEHEHRHERDEGAQARRRGRRSSGRRASNASAAAGAGPGAAPSPAASTTASARRRSKGEKTNGQQQDQPSKSKGKSGASGADAEMKGAFAVEEDEGVDATQLNTTERAIDATRIASPSPASAAAAAAAAGSMGAGGVSEPGSGSALHVAFGTPSRRRDLSDSVQTAQRERVYESALESITRAEQGFHSYVLSSAQAAEMRPSSGDDAGASGSAGAGDASQSQPLPPAPAGALLRKLLRFEPRGLRRPGEPSRAAQVSGASSMLGSGNLVFYDLVVGPAAAQKFKLSAEEEALVRRMDAWEHRADVSEPPGLGESARPLPADAEDNPAGAPIFSADRYAALLRQRRGVSLTLDRKAGIIPLRRIRELRAGVVGGATRLVGAVNTHLAALNIDESDWVRPEWCVSLLLDRGMVAQARPRQPDADDAAGHACASASVSKSASFHHESHALKHEKCVAEFAPELCPRVTSSFGRASNTASAKLRREVARNQRKNLGTTAAGAGVGVGAGAMQWGSDSDDAMGDGGGSIGATRSSLGRPQARSHSRPRSQSQSQSHGPAGASWVVVCTSSAEDAHTLINALMFLKLLAGQTVSSKDAQALAKDKEKEVVHLLPGASPLRKRSKQGEAQAEAEVIAPERLTDVLLSAAQHAAQAEAQLQAQRQASARSATRRPLLKRKSVPTPSVRTEFAMPSLPARPSLRASLAASLTPARVAAKAAAAAASSRGQQKEENKENEASVASQWAAAKVASQTPTPSKPAHKIARDAVRDRNDDHDEEYEDDYEAAEAGGSARASFAQRSPAPAKGAGASASAASARASGGLTLSQLGNGGNAHAAHDAALTVHESEPRAAVATWLQKKEAESERTRRRAEAAAAKAAEARAAKQRESAEALERWQKKQAELAAEKQAQQAKQRADAAAAKAEKEAAHAARKAAAKKAYAAFLARANARAEALARSQRLSAQEAARAARERKRAAQERFQQWVAQKSDWFVGRVQNIKDRQMERKRMADGDMNGVCTRATRNEGRAVVLCCAVLCGGREGRRVCMGHTLGLFFSFCFFFFFFFFSFSSSRPLGVCSLLVLLPCCCFRRCRGRSGRGGRARLAVAGARSRVGAAGGIRRAQSQAKSASAGCIFSVRRHRCGLSIWRALLVGPSRRSCCCCRSSSSIVARRRRRGQRSRPPLRRAGRRRHGVVDETDARD